VVQAYFDGDCLRVLKNDWINLEEEDHEKAKLVLAWIMSETGGNTCAREGEAGVSIIDA
jgi:hypothetical protein